MTSESLELSFPLSFSFICFVCLGKMHQNESLVLFASFDASWKSQRIYIIFFKLHHSDECTLLLLLLSSNNMLASLGNQAYKIWAENKRKKNKRTNEEADHLTMASCFCIHHPFRAASKRNACTFSIDFHT